MNPQVDTACSNLWLGYYYCIQPVGTITTYPGYGGVTTTVETSTITWVTPSMTTLLSNSSSTNYTSDYPVIPLADDTRVDCETYEQARDRNFSTLWLTVVSSYVWFSNLTDNEAADCWALAWVYGISGEVRFATYFSFCSFPFPSAWLPKYQQEQELVLWNPSLAQNETEDSASAATTAAVATATATSTATDAESTNEYTYACTIAASTSYCVALASATDSQPPLPSPSPLPSN